MTNLSKPRLYYSARQAASPEARRIDLPTLKALFLSAYEHLQSNGYFDEAFGSFCVDTGDIEGTVGSNVEAYVLFSLMKEGIWPIKDHIEGYEESDLFDVIEFMFDHVSKPEQKDWHDWNGCGYHYSDFNIPAGQREYRQRINMLLEPYGPGYELNEKGELMELAPKGLKHLLTAKPPSEDSNVTDRVQAAVERFRRYGSAMEDRQNAVRELVDVLEWLRPKIKTALLKKDEQELFQLANNFGIRHLRQNQKLDYDRLFGLAGCFITTSPQSMLAFTSSNGRSGTLGVCRVRGRRQLNVSQEVSALPGSRVVCSDFLGFARR